MNVEHLVKMTNEIAAFFAAESGPEQAARDVAAHLRRFWEPRMRQQIVAHYRAGGAGLDEIPRRAVALLAGEGSAAA